MYDGRLEAQEVYALDLSATDLVVLSACQSSLGELSAGDELVGLTRAFFFAGTPTVLSSLWEVDDSATKELMVAFYRNRQARMGKAEALQAAQKEVSATYASPFYWAAFVLNGDPGTPPLAPATENVVGEIPEPPAKPGPGVYWGAAGLVIVLVVGIGYLLMKKVRSQTLE